MHREALISSLSIFALLNPSLASSGDAEICNANHIFNAIHSSMRQWGGSLNHNGMSFFLATVPEGTQLYHGTSNPESIKGIEWLAFEPEHALIFARPRGGHGPGGPPPGEKETSFGSDRDERVSDLDDLVYDEEDWKHHDPPPGHERGPGREHGRPPPPHHDEKYNRPDLRPPLDDEDREHHRPPPPHKGKPCNDADPCPPPHHGYGPPPPDHKHREHGPPPPLPSGHIYKPYPPPHRGRPYEGPRRPSKPDWHGPPRDNHDHQSPHPPQLHDHRGDLPKFHGPQTEHNDDQGSSAVEHPADEDHPEPIELRSAGARPSSKRQVQQPLLSSPSSNDEAVGYLHTYRPLHDLHLLYIDGLSAGKTSNGTLDSQDLLLLNLTSGDQHGPSGPHGPMGDEMARAQGLCNLTATLWQHRINGVIRLEGGFEIILCDFEAHLERVDVLAIGSEDKQRGPMGHWEYTKAVASRYHGIGGGRVRVDYEGLVSVFAADVRGLWEGEVKSDVRMPRLTNVAAADLARVRDDLTTVVLAKDWSTQGRDWQAVADMAVARYSAPLRHVATSPAFRRDKEELAQYLKGLLRPFVDAEDRNVTRETERCVEQIVPTLPSLNVPPGSVPPLAHRAVHTVGKRICDTLLTSLSIATSSTPHSRFSTVYAEHAVELVAELVEWLGWTTWKECGTCGDEEVCFIPIWPTGTFEDHANPKCRGAKEVEGRTGYWGLRRGPPPGKPSADQSSGDGRKGKTWWKL